MTPRVRHTQIIEMVDTDFGTLVREDCHGYPTEESNLYLVDPENNVLWFAQRAMKDDCYANAVIPVSKDKIKCFSGKGVECEIDLRTGRLIGAELVR